MENPNDEVEVTEVTTSVYPQEELQAIVSQNNEILPLMQTINKYNEMTNLLLLVTIGLIGVCSGLLIILNFRGGNH